MKRHLTRRQALERSAVGFGGLALNSMMAWGAEQTPSFGLQVKRPHFPPRDRKSVV